MHFSDGPVFSAGFSKIPLFVIANTAGCPQVPLTFRQKNKRGLAMKNDKDIAALLELLRMAAEQWPLSGTGEVSQGDLFRRDQSLLQMWPEACRRTGVGGREFPPGVIKLWKQRLGRVN